MRDERVKADSPHARVSRESLRGPRTGNPRATPEIPPQRLRGREGGEVAPSPRLRSLGKLRLLRPRADGAAD